MAEVVLKFVLVFSTGAVEAVGLDTCPCVVLALGASVTLGATISLEHTVLSHWAVVANARAISRELTRRASVTVAVVHQVVVLATWALVAIVNVTIAIVVTDRATWSGIRSRRGSWV